MEENSFLMVDYEDMKKGLSPLDLLIVSKVKEYERMGKKCYISNSDFCTMLNVKSKKTITNRIDELVNNGHLSRTYEEINGNKARCLFTIGSVKNTIAETKKSSLGSMSLDEKVEYFKGLRNKDNFKTNKDEEFY